MRLNRFYHPTELVIGQQITLLPEVHRHAIVVLRKALGETLTLFNGDGFDVSAKLVEIDKKTAMVELLSKEAVTTESPISIHLALALIKPDRFDWALQKATELGVTHISPIQTDFAQTKINEKQRLKKQQHWQAVIQAACEQSGRGVIPQLHATASLTDCLNARPSEARIVVLEPTASKPLKQAEIDTNTIVLCVGPEGGWSANELEALRQSGGKIYHLGPRILRTETAALAGVCMTQALWGDLGQ